MIKLLLLSLLSLAQPYNISIVILLFFSFNFHFTPLDLIGILYLTYRILQSSTLITIFK
jgi:hypothetical protein